MRGKWGNHKKNFPSETSGTNMQRKGRLSDWDQLYGLLTSSS